MQINKTKAIIEAILFSAGREVKKNELMLTLELSSEEIDEIITIMQQDYKNEERGIELIKINDGYQLCTKKDMYEYIYPVIDKRTKPNLSTASLETLSIIAYNPRKLLEYGLIEEAGKVDLPGKPMSYKTTNEFLKMFGYSSLNDLPELPRYKLDENKQIVIDDLLEEEKEGLMEAPNPEREEVEEEKVNQENN